MVSPVGAASAPSPEPCGQEARVSIEPATSSFTLDRDPRDRSGDRFLGPVGGRPAADDGDLRPGRLQPQAVRAADRRGVRRDHLPQGQGEEAAGKTVRRPAARRSTEHGGNTRSATGRGFAWERCPPRKSEKRKRAKAGKRYLWMREVRVLRDDGRQTSILTNRQDLSAVMVAYRIFSSLASGELLQVHGRRVCPGRPGRIRGGGTCRKRPTAAIPSGFGSRGG